MKKRNSRLNLDDDFIWSTKGAGGGKRQRLCSAALAIAAQAKGTHEQTPGWGRALGPAGRVDARRRPGPPLRPRGYSTSRARKREHDEDVPSLGNLVLPVPCEVSSPLLSSLCPGRRLIKAGEASTGP